MICHVDGYIGNKVVVKRNPQKPKANCPMTPKVRDLENEVDEAKPHKPE